jgi:hypothetical protein
MTVTMAIRYSVSNMDVATKEAKRAKAMWTNAGARDFRSRQFFTGQFHGEWLFHIDFDDFTHLQKCRDAVQKSKDLKTIVTNNAKAGNKQMAREVLLGLDI